MYSAVFYNGRYCILPCVAPCSVLSCLVLCSIMNCTTLCRVYCHVLPFMVLYSIMDDATFNRFWCFVLLFMAMHRVMDMLCSTACGVVLPCMALCSSMGGTMFHYVSPSAVPCSIACHFLLLFSIYFSPLRGAYDSRVFVGTSLHAPFATVSSYRQAEPRRTRGSSVGRGGRTGASPLLLSHPSRVQLEALVASGEVLRGRLDVLEHNPREAFVLVRGAGGDRLGGGGDAGVLEGWTDERGNSRVSATRYTVDCP